MRAWPLYHAARFGLCLIVSRPAQNAAAPDAEPRYGRDGWLTAAVAALTAFGVVFQVRLAGTLPGQGDWLPVALGAGGGVLAAWLAGGGRFGRTVRGRGAWIVYGVAVLLVAALLVFGRRYRGGLYLPGLVNPSELVKLCLVVACAGWLGGMGAGRVKRFVTLAAGTGVLVGLVACAGDFGLAAQLVMTATVMVWLASWWWGGAACALLGGVVWAIAQHPMGHLATRFAVWRDPFADVTGAGWQTLQGLTALVSGGVNGTGFGLGDVRAVPIVSSDFVYAALAEELGLAGCAAILGLWCFVFVRGLMAAARRAREGDFAAALAAGGLVASLALQMLLNVAGVLNALPMTGITLPLVSLGGSSLATTLVMCGLLVGLSASSPPSKG